MNRGRNSIVKCLAAAILAPCIAAGDLAQAQAAGNRAPTDEYQESHALVIGAGRYTGGWNRLRNVAAEVQEVANTLKRRGFNVVTMLHPTGSELRTAVEDFIAKYGYARDNRLVLFFGGHGHTRRDDLGYIVPVDAPDPFLNKRGFLRKAVSMFEVITWARKIEAKHALFVFDSCFSGTLFKSRSHDPSNADIGSTTFKPVRQFITAGDAGQEVPAKSIFTPLFIRGLDGEADYNEDGYITGRELGLYLKQTVPSYGTEQTPQFGTPFDPSLDEGDIVFGVPDIVKAKQQLKAGRLTEPKGDNAFESYRRILAANPDDEDAHAGLEKVAARIEALARDEWKAGKVGPSLSRLEHGLKAFPGRAGLLALRREITRSRRLDELLAKAERQFASAKLTAPGDDNAYATYREILDLDPQNPRALAGIQDIATHYEEQAHRALTVGRLEEALAAIGQGLQLAPGRSDLLWLQTRINRDLKARVSREPPLVASLLAKAQAHMNASRYFHPAGDNAYETYRKVLAIEPDNEQALEGIRRIGQAFEGGTQAKLRSEEIERPIRQPKQSERIEALLTTAKGQLAELRLTTPKGDNAYESFKQVLTMDAGNRQALDGLRAIAKRYETLARNKRRTGDLQGGLAMAKRGLKVEPGHRGLLKLQEQIELALSERRPDTTTDIETGRTPPPSTRPREKVRKPEKRRLFGSF